VSQTRLCNKLKKKWFRLSRPKKNERISNLENQVENEENQKVMVESRVEWYNQVQSKYYKIRVEQNNLVKNYVIESTNECKQISNIAVLPSVPAYIGIIGFDKDPKTNPHQKANDVYKTKYTINIDDENTYSYENLTTTRRKDHETNGSVVYETSLSEGVCSQT